MIRTNTIYLVRHASQAELTRIRGKPFRGNNQLQAIENHLVVLVAASQLYIRIKVLLLFGYKRNKNQILSGARGKASKINLAMVAGTSVL